jgi:hypothetical protein
MGTSHPVSLSPSDGERVETATRFRAREGGIKIRITIMITSKSMSASKRGNSGPPPPRGIYR